MILYKSKKTHYLAIILLYIFTLYNEIYAYNIIYLNNNDNITHKDVKNLLGTAISLQNIKDFSEKTDNKFDMFIILGGEIEYNNYEKKDKIIKYYNYFKNLNVPILISGYATIEILKNIDLHTKTDNIKFADKNNILKINPISYFAKYIVEEQCNTYDNNGWIYIQTINTKVPLIELNNINELTNNNYRIVAIDSIKMSIDIIEHQDHSITLFRDSIENIILKNNTECMIKTLRLFIKNQIELNRLA